MKFLGNGAVFAAIYIVCMIPTYYLPYMGSNSEMISGSPDIPGLGISPETALHLLAMALQSRLKLRENNACDDKFGHVFVQIFPSFLGRAFRFIQRQRPTNKVFNDNAFRL